MNMLQTNEKNTKSQHELKPTAEVEATHFSQDCFNF